MIMLDLILKSTFNSLISYLAYYSSDNGYLLICTNQEAVVFNTITVLMSQK